MFAARNMPQASRRNGRNAKRDQIALRAAADVRWKSTSVCTRLTMPRPWRHQLSCRRRDGELAVALLRVGLTGARSNLEARLSTLTDVVYTKRSLRKVAHLTEKAMTAARAAEVSVQAPPA